MKFSQRDLQEVFDKRLYELFSKEEWEQAVEKESRIGINMELNEMIETVLDDIFETSPSIFGNAPWINDDNGLPVWVRPGVEWEMDEDDPED
jgi:hypothetical protein